MAKDDWQRNVERVIGSRNRVLRRDEFDTRITDKESVGSESCREDDQNYGKRAEQQGGGLQMCPAYGVSPEPRIPDA